MDTYAHILAAASQAEEAAQAFTKAARAEPLRLLQFARRMQELGFPANPADPAAFEAALLACARTGAACRLSD